MIEPQTTLALLLAREWQQTIAALATDTVECLEIVREIEFKPGVTGHPFYLGKMSLLEVLRELADADVKRFETPGGVKFFDEHFRLQESAKVARKVISAARLIADSDLLNLIDEYEKTLK